MRAEYIWALFAMIAATGRASDDPVWDSRKSANWPKGFELVTISSSMDGKTQRAWVHRSLQDGPRPLLVSLHTWGGNFAQADPLAALAAAADWNYIHPDFRGPNIRAEACLSRLVVSDVDDAISYMLADQRVDAANVFLVGVSGGGQVACGMFMQSRHSLRRILAWVPITDLKKWHEECSGNPALRHYAKDILACAGDASGQLIEAEALARSPLYMAFPTAPSRGIDIFAGIDDGWKGSVPVSHSIRFYNRLADHFGAAAAKVTDEESSRLCGRTLGPAADLGPLGDRAVLLSRGFERVTLTIFKGGHEMLSQACFNRIQTLAGVPTAGDGLPVPTRAAQRQTGIGQPAPGNRK